MFLESFQNLIFVENFLPLFVNAILLLTPNMINIFMDRKSYWCIKHEKVFTTLVRIKEVGNILALLLFLATVTYFFYIRLP